MYATLVIGIFAVLVGATVGTGVPAIDEPATEFAEASGVASAWNNSTANADDSASSRFDGINRTRIEYRVHYFINQERTERGLSRLRFNEQIHKAARYHSEDMANRTYFAHDSPEGNDFEDRYQRFGIDCSVRVSSTMRSGGAENIAYTYAYTDIRADNGETIDHDGNETQIARGLVNQWMNSSGHRKNILQPYWNTEAIGVAVTETDEGTRVYATQNFC